MSGHIVGIAQVGARFVAYHGDAGLGGRTGHVRGKVKV